eukprot:SAG31_NODE_32287_length_357_cov_1.321705_1_plen_97_part_10
MCTCTPKKAARQKQRAQTDTQISGQVAHGSFGVMLPPEVSDIGFGQPSAGGGAGAEQRICGTSNWLFSPQCSTATVGVSPADGGWMVKPSSHSTVAC